MNWNEIYSVQFEVSVERDIHDIHLIHSLYSYYIRTF